MGMLVDRQPPTPNKPRLRRLLLAALLGVCSVPVSLPVTAHAAGDAASKLQDVERKIQSQNAESARQKARAAALKAEMSSVGAALVAAAKRVQDQEVQVAAIEVELLDLEREAGGKTQRLRERRHQFSGVVMALTKIARFPTEALIAQPIPPEDTVRSAILLRAAVPAIEVRAASLQSELQDLARARTQVETRRSELQTAVDRLRVEQVRIEAIRKQKAALRAEAISKSRAAQSKANKLARTAKSLRDLMDRLETERKKAEAEAKRKARSTLHVKPDPSGNSSPVLTPKEVAALGGIGSISKARGRLPFPVVGKMVGLYGQSLDGGQTRKGLSLETRVGAQVIAPFEGKVVFAGPFRGYGQLLIIDHGEGYHSLLAGMGRIDAVIGQPVLAGEPVASMTPNSGSSSGEQAILYVEFRRNNQPINPLPWLASRKGTPKG